MAYWVLKRTLGPVLRLVYRVRVEGLANVPASGPAILAANHASFCDSIFLPLVLPRRVTFVAKAEYFERRRTAWFFRAVGQIPISRVGGAAADRALDAARAVLERGGLLGIYPEGTRSPDGRLYKGHTGVARLAVLTGAPVVAVALSGTREVQPIGRRLPKVFLPVTVRFSAPMAFRRCPAQSTDAAVLRQVTDEVMCALRRLGGQKYVDRYCNRGDDDPLVAGEAAEPATGGRS